MPKSKKSPMKKPAAKKAPKKPKVIERIYDGVGPYYNFVFGKLFFQDGRETAIELLNVKPKEKILEVGVGTGLTLPVYPRTSKVIGVDISASMLKEAEELIQAKGLKHVSVEQGDATKLRFADNSFDGVLGNLFISATSFPRESLLEMKRVCKPGGMIVLMNHFKSEHKLLGAMETAFNPVAQRIGFKSNLEMGPLLESVGLKPLEIRKVNILNLWTAVSMVNEK
ncbi:MAG: class I SAM-dependent methyltransferase [Proteobacteria bacterium]|nr:MAG: class I SAM-dependent methyltransferase [Pseudomonadota bacterium]